VVDRIIKFLGGYTREEYNLTSLERDSYKSSSDMLKGQILQAEKYFEFVNQEGKTFKDLFMMQMGYGQSSEARAQNPDLQPLQTGPVSARQLMREMEADDRKRASQEQKNGTGEPQPQSA
jgi:hypothetical protein